MRFVLLAAALVVGSFATARPAAAQGDPLAQARDYGAVECIGPNPVARTCEVISAYRFGENGDILNDYVMHIQNDPLLLASGVERVFLRGGMVCSTVEPEDVAAMNFTIDGAEVSEKVGAEFRAIFARTFVGVEEVCTRYVWGGELWRLVVFTDGVEQPDLSVEMTWVRREDGYVVGGADGPPT